MQYENFYISSNGLTSIQRIPTNRGGRMAIEIRDSFSKYFMSPSGSLSWKMSKI